MCSAMKMRVMAGQERGSSLHARGWHPAGFLLGDVTSKIRIRIECSVGI